jgi:hypothetical protein
MSAGESIADRRTQAPLVMVRGNNKGAAKILRQGQEQPYGAVEQATGM